MSDPYLFHTADGGEIHFENRQIEMESGLRTAVYLSLFGGNEDDSGSDADEPKEWWGNKGETDPNRKYRSEFQYLLKRLPLISSNLVRFEDAASRDLAWLTESVADEITVTATIPRLNTLHLEIVITVENEDYRIAFEETVYQEAA